MIYGNLCSLVIVGNLLCQPQGDVPWCGIQIRSKQATGYDPLQISNNRLHGNPGHTAENTGIEVNAASAGVLDGNLISEVDTGVRLGKDASGWLRGQYLCRRRMGVPTNLF